jgi:acyl carrier protein
VAGEDTAGRVTVLIGRVVGRDPAAIDLAARWSALGLDSLDLLDLFVACEREFAIAIPDEALPRLRCGGDLVSLVQARGRGSAP